MFKHQDLQMFGLILKKWLRVALSKWLITNPLSFERFIKYLLLDERTNVKDGLETLLPTSVFFP